MKLRKWENLPENMRTEAVRPYYEVLDKKRGELAAKRAFDVMASSAMIVATSPLLIGVAAKIKKDDHGPAFFRQTRVTQYGKEFRIFKFRTMVVNADKLGAQVTSQNDPRITPSGEFLRKYRIDELPQLFNILLGDMTFVGTRPEVPKYVAEYSDEMMATLLLPAGVTSEASIKYKDEAELLTNAEDADATYIKEVLPEKMKYNLEQIKEFGLAKEFGLLFKTVLAVLK